MHHVLSGTIPDPRETNPDIPAELERIIRKALAFRREDRYATAAELESDLTSFLGGGAPVTSRDVSNFISHQFAGVRAERKHAVNLELQRRAALGPAPLGSWRRPLPLAHDFSSSGDHASGSATPSSPRSALAAQSTPANVGVSIPPPRPTSRRSGILAVGALLVADGPPRVAPRRSPPAPWDAVAAPPASGGRDRVPGAAAHATGGDRARHRRSPRSWSHRPVAGHLTTTATATAAPASAEGSGPGVRVATIPRAGHAARAPAAPTVSRAVTVRAPPGRTATCRTPSTPRGRSTSRRSASDREGSRRRRPTSAVLSPSNRRGRRRQRRSRRAEARDFGPVASVRTQA